MERALRQGCRTKDREVPFSVVHARVVNGAIGNHVRAEGPELGSKVCLWHVPRPTSQVPDPPPIALIVEHLRRERSASPNPRAATSSAYQQLITNEDPELLGVSWGVVLNREHEELIYTRGFDGECVTRVAQQKRGFRRIRRENSPFKVHPPPTAAPLQPSPRSSPIGLGQSPKARENQLLFSVYGQSRSGCDGTGELT